ncbi:glycosyltransferase family 2 protein [Chryseobacterium chendengshani]|uniref:glycosyltransferase family 2 protein n=1 Tax=Chryseobacterium sp. LJ668 TaxID=2864040 RepID=UPI001C6886D2|nr:glycosyltransferase family 2 protein [Chryseobacterium sp. LJ668]MBW8522068.1 glycosyltransferase family 2 protein [Chryseobacterium sp. LJ668]QYK17718.1 glycosyltransferase family 2 protein [Chryseobacterium sp. LJ668]
MKLSVCIPVYNFDVRQLVYNLNDEIKRNKINAEIILIDDASESQFKSINETLKNQVRDFIFLEKNIGRSKIRNLFLEYAVGEYFLFLDCDGKIIDPDFLKKYIQFIEQNPNAYVIYGGRTVCKNLPEDDYILRWKFAVKRENLAVSERARKAYLSFQTNNFVIQKETLRKINFNSEFEKYGYEDLLFAMELKSKTIKINHIENPVFNNDIETSKVYIKKVNESIESLARMLKNTFIKDKLSEIKLVRAYHFIKKTHSEFLFLAVFNLINSRIKKNLLSGNPNLRNLDMYKLGLLLGKMKN